MRVVPEGVETAGQLARLTELGCDFAQGFHLSRPLPAAALEALAFTATLSTNLGDHEGLRPPVRRPA
jgi:EAL domain-containing protein (putative c-di-GMP-specific phosphodiesterase class I)